jgi:hypothetical protein
MNESNNVTRTVDNTTSKGRTVEIRRLPMYAGSQWMGDGLKQIARNPSLMLWVALTLAIYHPLTYFCETLVTKVPGYFSANLATFIVAISSFALCANLTAIYRGVARGEKPSLKMFITPTKERAIPLLMLGGLACLLLAVLPITRILIDAASSPPDYSSLEIILPLTLLIILFTIFIMAFYFAPPLIAFHECSMSDAIKHSFSTCLKNWKPLLFNFVAIILMYSILYIFPIYILSIYLYYINSPIVSTFIFSALSFIPACIFYANYYQSYNALFSDSPEQHPRTGNGTSSKTGSAVRILAAALITIVICAAIIGLIKTNKELSLFLFYMLPITLILTPLVIILITNLVCSFMKTPRWSALWISLGLIVLGIFIILSLFLG